jgi:ketosteroid isomerase-like protein
MMEYRQLFTQLKMTQVPERVKLQLSALRHDPIFANTQRKKKLDLRVCKNVDYFKKTDISGILQGYKDSITLDTWQKIRDQKQDWVDTYSNEDIYEMMRKSTDNILCLGIFVQRDEEVISNPAKGLKLLKVTNTIISYNSFINGMNQAKNNQQAQGQFATLNDLYSITGALADEQINAVIPLYINDEHMKRIRILEGIWLGYLYTLDSYGYDKQQEVALLKLLYEIIQQRTNTQRQKLTRTGEGLSIYHR